MKKMIYIILLIFGYTAYSQSLLVFNVDASAFPIVKADFFAFDDNGDYISDFLTSDFQLMENGIQRTVTNISCPTPNPPIPLSSVLVIDVSGSMLAYGLNIAKAAANAWVDMIVKGKSECAITSFSDLNYLNQDFTKSKTKLINGINGLTIKKGTKYNAALIDPEAGGILIAKTGKYKRVIVFLTDGDPGTEPRTMQIINEAKANNITIYCLSIDMPAPQCLKDFANQTGGLYFENVETQAEAKDYYRKILITAQGGDPCQIEWKSEAPCVAELNNVELKLIQNNAQTNASYLVSENSIKKLEFSPVSSKFSNAVPGVKNDKIVTVTAQNTDFNITNIVSSNPDFSISPTSFFINSGQSFDLTVSYLPQDSAYSYTKFTFENTNCPTNYYASGGFIGKKPAQKSVHLIQPNGGEVFIVGADTSITWEGVLPEDKVSIDYSTNNGANWTLVADTASGLRYNWRVPKTISNQCLARVTANTNNIFGCDNGDILICNQVWMGCNLDVDTYRNGDPIPEVTDPTEWANLKTGAWCYYNNFPALGRTYGRLYNWYAVTDPRGLAPKGWHIPKDAEWAELEKCLGGSDIAGGKLKSIGTLENDDGLWRNPNIDATNEAGFSAQPGGYRFNYGVYDFLERAGYWWTATESDKGHAWLRSISYNNTIVGRGSSGKDNGFSVRCVKD
jgi:uncharacterized protein (TIGR02145 family)